MCDWVLSDFDSVVFDPDKVAAAADARKKPDLSRFYDDPGWIIPSQHPPEVVARARLLSSELALWIEEGAKGPFRSILEKEPPAEE